MNTYGFIWGALSLDEDVYEAYKKYCEKHSIIISRKIDKFMEEQLAKDTKWHSTKKQQKN